MRTFRLLSAVFFAALAFSSLGSFEPARADATIAAVPALGVRELLDAAGHLDGRATSLEDRAARSRQDARDMVDRAAALRVESKTKAEPLRARLAAKADDLEVRAVAARTSADSDDAEARRLRAKARDVRATAKVQASSTVHRPAGTLTATSNGACELSVDGIPVGSTPILRLELGVGSRQLECRDGAGARMSRTVTIREGAAESVVFASADWTTSF